MTLLARILILVCLALLPALAIQAYQRAELRSASERATQESALRTLALVEGELDRMIEGTRQMMKVVSETMAVRGQDKPACNTLLQRVSAGGMIPEAFTITDRNGVVWCASQPGSLGLMLSDRPHVREALATGGFVIGAHITGRTNQRSGLPFALAYRNSDGAIDGAVIAVIEADTLAKAMTTAALPHGSLVTLADSNGVILVCEPRLRQPGQMMEEHRRALLDARDRGTIEVHDADGIDRLVAYSPLAAGAPRLFVSVGLDRRAMFSGARDTALTGIGLMAVDLVAALALATFAYRRMIHRPLASIRAAALRWGRGDYSARPIAPRSGEFQDLFTAFTEMAEAVAGREEHQAARLDAERAANQAREMLSIAMEAADAGWWAWDVVDDVVTISQESARLLAVGTPDAITTSGAWLAIIHPEDCERVKAAGASEVSARHATHRLEYRVPTGADTVRWLASIGRTTFADDGRPLRMVGINIDITAQKRLEAELVAARRRAEEASRHKSSFLAAASHDLRQPVQSLMLFSASLAGRPHDPKEQAIIGHIEGAIRSLKALLDGLLDISRLDAGRVSPRIADHPLQPLFAQIASEYEPQARRKALRLRVVPTSLWISTDVALLDRVLRNLVENAIKYTSRGGIVVGCRRRGDAVGIEVLDTGIGIPEAELKAVFEEFHQIDNPEQASAKGLGLGLSIVHKLSQLLGYRISLDSVVGRGTRFAVLVPRVFAPSLPTPEAYPQRPGGLPACVALIEDEETVRQCLAKQLADWGVDVLAGADDGTVARGLGGRRPDVIIADYRLQGGLNGVQAIHRLVDSVGTAIPSLLLTGETDPQCLDEIRATGLTVLHKPLQPADLRRELSRMAGTG